MKLIQMFLTVAVSTSLASSLCSAAGVVSNCTQASLEAALAGGGDVTLACDGTIYLTNTITISANTVLDGSGRSVAISGNSSNRLFYVQTNASFTLKHLTLQEGWSTNGGAIWNDGGHLLASQCVFSNNIAAGWIGTNNYYTNAYGGAVSSSGTATFEDTTFVQNNSHGSDGKLSCGSVPKCFGFDAHSGYGGAVFNSGEMIFLRCTLNNNSTTGGNGPSGYYAGGNGGSAYGGALCNMGIVSLINCTLVANSASGGKTGVTGANGIGRDSGNAFGGAILNTNGQVILSSCTVVRNQAISGLNHWSHSISPLGTASGGSIGSLGSQVELKNTIIADSIEIVHSAQSYNSYLSTTNHANARGTLVDLGHNISSDQSCNFINTGSLNETNPLLGPLTDNGGWTKTMLLLSGSPAIDAGDTADFPSTDQRGIARPSGSVSDMGAVEMAPQPGKVLFSAAHYSIGENKTNIVATLWRAGGYVGSLSIDYAFSNETATAGADYVGNGDTVVFGDNEVSKTITIPIIDDSQVETNETFQLHLLASDPAVLGEPNPAQIIITNDDFSGVISVISTSAVENATQALIPVVRHGGDKGGVYVNFTVSPDSAAAGLDYAPVSGTLYFEEGETNEVIPVPIINDPTAESQERFKVTLSDPWGATIGTASVWIYIQDDDAILSFRQTIFTTDEVGTNAIITVTREGGLGATANVDFTTSSQTATAGVDYIETNGTLTFNPGETNKTFLVPIIHDQTAESNEAVKLTLFNATTGTVLIVSNAVLNINEQLPVPNTWFTGLGGIAIALSADGQSVVGNWGEVGKSQCFHWRKGVATTLEPPTVGPQPIYYSSVACVSSDGRFCGGMAFHNGAIWDNISQLSASGFRYPSYYAVGNYFRGVTPDGYIYTGDSGSNVMRWTSTTLTNKVFSQTLIGPGSAAGISADGTIVVGTMPNNEGFYWKTNIGMIGLGFLPGATNSFVSAISQDGNTIVGVSGNQAFRWRQETGMVGLGDLIGGTFSSSAKAVSPDGNVIVGWGTTPNGPQAFIWDATNGMRSLKTYLEDHGQDLTGWTLSEAVGISADGTSFCGNGSNGAWYATLNPQDQLSFASSRLSASEGNALQVSVTRRNPGSGSVSVNFAVTNGTALAGSDYVATNGTLQFATGQTNKTFTISVLSDSVDEFDETIFLTLSNPTAGAMLGGSNAVLTVIGSIKVVSNPDETSLRQALAGGGTVVFDSDETIYLTNTIVISTNTVLDGSGHSVTISGGGSNRIFKVAANASLTLKNLTLIDGWDGLDGQFAQGGAIYNEGTLNMTNCSVSNCVASSSFVLAQGGAIFNTNGSVQLDTVSFFNNRADSCGLRIDSYGGALCSINGTVAGNNVGFYQNVARGGNSLSAGFPPPSLPASSGHGGAIYVTNASLSLTNCVWVENLSEGGVGAEASGLGYGGAIYNDGHTSLSSCQFTNNLAKGGRGVTSEERTPGLPCSSGGNGNDGYGGAIYNANTLVLANLSFTGNLAQGGVGAPGCTRCNESTCITFPDGATGNGYGHDIYNTGSLSYPERGTFAFESATYTANENAGTILVNVTRNGGTQGTATIDFSTQNGTATAGSDYVATNGTLTFADGQTNATFSVDVLTDALAENPETVILRLNNDSTGTSLGSVSNATLTINDTSPRGRLSFQSSSVSVVEGNMLSITVIREDGTAGLVTAGYGFTPGTAIDGQDYQEIVGNVIFPEGVTSRTIVTAISLDDIYDPDETFTASLVGPTGGATLGVTNTTITIIEASPRGAFSFLPNSLSVSEGSGVTVQVVRQNGSAGNVSVDFATGDGTASAGSDYISTNGTFVFAEGETNKTFTVYAVSDALEDANETVHLTLSNPTGGASVNGGNAILTITRTHLISGDIVFQHTDGRLAFWVMDRTNFLSSQMLRSAPGWQAISLGDLDGDTKTDILFQHPDGRVGGWRMDGTNFLGSFILRNGTKLPAGWRTVGISDFNEDSHADILFQNKNGALAYWHLVGTNFIGSSPIVGEGAPSPAWKAVAIADLNRHASADIIFQPTSGRLMFWQMMNGDEFMAGAWIREKKAPDAGWRVVGTYDFNNDERIDLLFQHTDGRLAVWFLDGPNFLGSALVRNGVKAASGWRAVGVVP